MFFPTVTLIARRLYRTGVDYYLTERRPFSHSTTPRSIQMNTKAQPGVDKSQETDSDMEIFHAKLNNLGRSYSKNNHVSANAYKVSYRRPKFDSEEENL